jgi:hypothetical protein
MIDETLHTFLFTSTYVHACVLPNYDLATSVLSMSVLPMSILPTSVLSTSVLAKSGIGK